MDPENQRQQLIELLRGSGIRDERVLAAMAIVPREIFVDEAQRELAYTDRALPIDEGQTISQPLMVATMTQALGLSGRERALEIGTGSGYQEQFCRTWLAISTASSVTSNSPTKLQRACYTWAAKTFPSMSVMDRLAGQMRRLMTAYS